MEAVSLDLSDATVRDSLVDRPRIGALAASGVTWTRVRVRGGKVDFLVLDGARLRDVAFEGCVIGEST